MKSKQLLLFIIFLLPFKVFAETLPERIELFVDLFDKNTASSKYDIRILQTDFPTKLISPEFMLPQTGKYPLKDIQQLYHLSQTCSGKLPLSPTVTEPLVFVRALCKGTPLSKKWFARTGLIHPGGGTYAARYAKSHPDSFDELQSYMHIQERPKAEKQTLLGRLQRMSYSALTALIAGEKMFVDDGELWLRRGNNYFLYESDIWQKNVETAEISVWRTDKNSNCFVQRGNLCIEVQDQSNLLLRIMVALIIANVALIIGWAIYRWEIKRRELKNRMLVLQILTHELRTPIASLALTVEGFRREFERLPETVYDEFRRLCEDSRRLRQLAEASKDYLQSDKQPLATEWIPSIEEWLDYRYEESANPPTLRIENDRSVKVNVYWLGTCLDNLVNNAVKYGVAPVELEVEIKSNRVRFNVIDQGQLTSKDWKTLKKPFVSKAGLGLGLTIVESMVARMGGKMSLDGPPTTFTLEIPCETDIATR
ncbi:sensor histidine kinase VxrA [Vibrio hannami]|uniref:sensor histidine kinase VxrA n=1 Tax=Vibrio hannami TaxID=2717094 RepID=UPI003EB6EF32